jgi:hypothetical protein
VNETLFRTLLLQSESPELDFKRDQYAFKGADDLTKSKLLKDVLSFANSWRLGDAHILIGVEDLSTGLRNGRGILAADHIDDASLQQFVNSKTNREIRFSYQAFLYDGKSFGIITIPKQRRPFYGKKDFGIVKANEVYYRRGSSCAVATPDEIHQMGLDDEKECRASPIIGLEFADLSRRVPLGTSVNLSTINHEQHARTDYPDEVSDGWGFSSISYGVNRNYWREVADYVLTKRAFAAIGFVATNTSGELAKRVRVEIIKPTGSAVDLIGDADLPEFPSARRGVFSPKIFSSSLRDPPKGTPIVLKHDDQWTMEIDFGDIQPKATIWAVDPVYVSASTPGTHCLPVRIYADNLSQPQERDIQLDFSIEQRPRLTFEYLDKFQEEHWKQREKELDDFV